MSHPPVLRSGLLDALAGVSHAFFTRAGGVSAGVYESLNLGPGSRDDPAAVAQNQARAAAVFGVGPDALNVCYQIHSATVVHAKAPWGEKRPQADGVVTTRPGLICGALAADCAPVLIADAQARVVAAVHAGWRGALTGVIGAAVEAMTAAGARPARMVAVVGPCIAQPSYQVGPDFLAAFAAVDGKAERFFAADAAPDRRRFDLPGFVLAQIEAAGIERFEWIGRDTCAEEELFFSNRRAVLAGEGDYGRLLSAIMLDA